MMGFQDAFNNAIHVYLDPKIYVSVTSLPGFVILKLIAWQERMCLTKDAEDIAFILLNYINAGNQDRFFNKHADLITDDFDYGKEIITRLYITLF